MAEVGETYEDLRRPGRVVEVVQIQGYRVTVETVKAADAAVSTSAVGRQTSLGLHSLNSSFKKCSA